MAEVLKSLEEIKLAPGIHAYPPSNDNMQADLLADMMKNTFSSIPTMERVRELVQEEIIEFNCTNRIELKIGDVIKTLPDAPRHYLFKPILESVSCGIPSALIGPAGSGKSTLAEQIGQALDKNFYLQNGVTGTHELTGYLDAYGKYHSTPFRAAFEGGGLLLVDEVDTSDPGAFKWINTALANGMAMFPDQEVPVKRHADFRIIIAANTYGTGADRVYVGANQLDASTLDRFVFFDFGYDEKLERLLTNNPDWCNRVQDIRRGVEKEQARIVVSPRATLNGAKLLGAGWEMKDVEKAVIWKGIDLELKGRIEKHCTTSSQSTANKIMSKAERKLQIRVQNAGSKKAA